MNSHQRGKHPQGCLYAHEVIVKACCLSIGEPSSMCCRNNNHLIRPLMLPDRFSMCSLKSNRFVKLHVASSFVITCIIIIRCGIIPLSQSLTPVHLLSVVNITLYVIPYDQAVGMGPPTVHGKFIRLSPENIKRPFICCV